MNSNSDIAQVKKMLTALLKSQNNIHTIGGYVYGQTAGEDPFVILYPAADNLNHKVCRVYPHDFKKLPAFIPTDDIRPATDANPDKDKAIKRGIYHPCPMFRITTWDGKQTAMGAEKRFGDVLYASKAQNGTVAPAPQASKPPARPLPGDRSDQTTEPDILTKPNPAMVKDFEALGERVYGAGWATKRAELASWATGKRSDNPDHLTRGEIETLIAGMKAKEAKKNEQAAEATG